MASRDSAPSLCCYDLACIWTWWLRMIIRLGRRVDLSECKLCGFRYTIVIGWTTIAASLTSSPIAATTAWTCALRFVIRCHECLTNSAVHCLRRGTPAGVLIGMCRVRNAGCWLTRCSALDRHWTMLISGLIIQAARITYGLSLW
jgi:hypothetical protein